jgi:hypothetical protein
LGLCSLITRKLDVPGEEGQWIEIRPLSAKRLHAIELEAKKLGREALAANDDDTDAENYTTASLVLREAIVSWSYAAEVTPDNVDDLEVSTMMWLSGQIGQGSEIPLASTPISTGSSAEKTPAE